MDKLVYTIILILLLCSSFIIFNIATNHTWIIPNHIILVGILILIRIISLVYILIYIKVWYIHKWPIDFKTLKLWLSPLLVLNIIGLLCIFIGQLLNISVYMTIGIDGVYYINEFDKSKNNIDYEYTKSFPYNILDNPQYIGCILYSG